MALSPQNLGRLAAATTVLLWASFIVVARASATHVLLPLDIAFLRIVGASLVLLPWAWWLMREQRQKGASVGSLWGLSPLPLRVTVQAGFFGGLMFALLVYIGFFFAPAAHASVLLPGSLPLWTTLLMWLFLSEHIGLHRALGLGLILVGDILVGGLSLLKAFDGGEVWRGDVLFMSASICWAAYSVTVRQFGLDAVRATMAIIAFAFVSFLPAYVLLVGLGLLPSHFAQASWTEILLQASFQGLGSVVISGISFTQMIRSFGPVKSTMITALVPGLSAFGAVVVLEEPLSWNLAAGLALVTCGILLGVRQVAAKTAT
jgi:drug/metabolite transporter (DMT)-like permease